MVFLPPFNTLVSKPSTQVTHVSEKLHRKMILRGNNSFKLRQKRLGRRFLPYGTRQIEHCDVRHLSSFPHVEHYTGKPVEMQGLPLEMLILYAPTELQSRGQQSPILSIMNQYRTSDLFRSRRK